jgi:hypothetical protein
LVCLDRGTDCHLPQRLTETESRADRIGRGFETS